MDVDYLQTRWQMITNSDSNWLPEAAKSDCYENPWIRFQTTI